MPNGKKNKNNTNKRTTETGASDNESFRKVRIPLCFAIKNNIKFT